MSNEMALMKKGEATMNVPAAKIQQFVADGWIEISRTVVAAEVKQPAVKAEMPIPVAAKGKKSASK